MSASRRARRAREKSPWASALEKPEDTTCDYGAPRDWLSRWQRRRRRGRPRPSAPG
jgi:hypothetical protein